MINSLYDGNSRIKLLDVGCGKGYMTNEILKSFCNFEISALDYSISAIEYASDKFKNIDFIVANAYDPPYKEGYFDVIVMNNIWEHVPDPLNLLSQIKKILKTDGHIVISTPSRYRLGNILNKIKGRPVTFMSSMHVTEYSVGQVVEQLNYGGFSTEKIYSRENYEIKTTKQIIIFKIIKPIVYFALRRMNPLNCLESTCYFLAKKI